MSWRSHDQSDPIAARLNRVLVPVPRDQAASLLAAAFLLERDFRLAFWRIRRLDAKQARAFFDLQVESAQTCSAEPLGILCDGILQAVITCHAPQTHGFAMPRLSWRAIGAEIAYSFRVPAAVRSRIDHYSRWSAAHGPKEPHHFVTALGVAPSSQGQGLAAVLLEEIVELSRADPSSRGVAISTYSRGKSGFYQKLGFEPIHHAFVDGVESWVLYRGN